MKKSFSVNIGGMIFQIDEDAYEKLNRYLDRLNLHFTNTEGKGEIITDIEQRIAEMLIEKLGDQNRIVTLAVIEEIIVALGEPADFDDTQPQPETGFRSYRKRLYRDPDDRILGGVAGGMGAYFNVDPLWFRIAFIVITIIGVGTGLLIYLIMWFIIPEARTTAERLEMRGEEINIGNIERFIREEMNDIKDRFGRWKRDGYRKKKDSTSRLIETTGQVFATLFMLFFRFLAAIIGIAIIITGIALLIAIFIPGFTLQGFPFIFDVTMHELLYMVTGNEGVSWLLFISLILIILLPLLGILWAGIRLLWGIRGRNHGLGLSFTGLWILAVIFCAVLSVTTLNDFKIKGQVTEKSRILSQPSDTLLIGLNNSSLPEWTDFDEVDGNALSMSYRFTMKDDRGIIAGQPQVEFIQHPDDTLTLSIIKRSRGNSHEAAQLSALDIHYGFVENGKALWIDPYFTTKPGSLYRNQQVKVNLYIPEGQHFMLDKSLQERYSIIRNFDPLWDEMILKKCLVMNNGKIEIAE